MSAQIKIFDTTLRDGEQSPGCSMNLNEKIEMAKQLEKLKVDIIEAGFAIASPGDFESVRTIAETVHNVTVASLARAVKGDIDAAWEAVRVANKPRIHVFLATSPLHMQYKLQMTPDEVIAKTAEMVKYAKHYCDDIEFSAEDATRSEKFFLSKVIETAIANGATTVNIPDTVGYATPDEMYNLMVHLRQTVKGIDNV
ncbi:MAG: 2-isopropylmalate synthase, partial [Firmicutes bacterium]|nr:2-isopropylmalate synthase [Bacillota bacterium]